MVGRRTVIIGPCGSSGGGGLATNNCCGTIYQAGSVDLDGLEWATDYTITLASPIGTVTVTDQGSGTWESDVVEVTCTVDEVEVTDEYTVTMTATGNAPGEVIVTVALTLGGGYGGASGCCETTEGGFAWKYVNCCIVDPLAGWSMTRDPSGFSGKECEIGGCEICVTPLPLTGRCHCGNPEVIRFTVSGAVCSEFNGNFYGQLTAAFDISWNEVNYELSSIIDKCQYRADISGGLYYYRALINKTADNFVLDIRRQSDDTPVTSAWVTPSGSSACEKHVLILTSSPDSIPSCGDQSDFTVTVLEPPQA